MYVTCLAPPERVMVPRSDAVTPLPAPGVPVVVSGGHAVAHWPEQLDLPPRSAAHTSSARPLDPVR